MDSAIVCSIYVIVISLCLTSVDIVTCQGSCNDDSDCSGKFPCCSKFGYCGAGEGYCTDPEEEVVETIEPVTNANDTGCYMPNIEIIGGDLPHHVGGGGLQLDPGQQVRKYTVIIKTISGWHSDSTDHMKLEVKILYSIEC